MATNNAQRARRAQEAAWRRWQQSDSAEDQAAWEAAAEAQWAAEDRWEAEEASRENQQADWWDAAMANARN